MELPDRRDMYNGFADSLSRAVELAVTPLVFAGLGFLLDRWLGLVPLLTMVFFLWALAVTTYMAWSRYDTEMRRHEEQRAARRAGAPADALARGVNDG